MEGDGGGGTEELGTAAVTSAPVSRVLLRVARASCHGPRTKNAHSHCCARGKVVHKGEEGAGGGGGVRSPQLWTPKAPLA